jgi:hypothetical protein
MRHLCRCAHVNQSPPSYRHSIRTLRPTGDDLFTRVRSSTPETAHACSLASSQPGVVNHDGVGDPDLGKISDFRPALHQK